MKYKIHRSGELRGDKIEYPDGVSCSIWYPLEENGDHEGDGVCFDFSLEDIDDLISLLNILKSVSPDNFIK